MVIHHIHDDGYPTEMSGIHQFVVPIHSTVRRLYGKRIDTIVSPVAHSGELREGHQLDGGDAQVRQVVQLDDDALEIMRRGKAPRMQLVDDHIRQCKPLPVAVRPVKAVPFEQLRWTVNAAWLRQARWVGTYHLTVDPVIVPGTQWQGHTEMPVAIDTEGHIVRPVIPVLIIKDGGVLFSVLVHGLELYHELHFFGKRGPYGKVAAVGLIPCADGMQTGWGADDLG